MVLSFDIVLTLALSQTKTMIFLRFWFCVYTACFVQCM